MTLCHPAAAAPSTSISCSAPLSRPLIAGPAPFPGLAVVCEVEQRRTASGYKCTQATLPFACTPHTTPQATYIEYHLALHSKQIAGAYRVAIPCAKMWSGSARCRISNTSAGRSAVRSRSRSLSGPLTGRVPLERLSATFRALLLWCPSPGVAASPNHDGCRSPVVSSAHGAGPEYHHGPRRSGRSILLALGKSGGNPVWAAAQLHMAKTSPDVSTPHTPFGATCSCCVSQTVTLASIVCIAGILSACVRPLGSAGRSGTADDIVSWSSTGTGTSEASAQPQLAHECVLSRGRWPRECAAQGRGEQERGGWMGLVKWASSSSCLATSYTPSRRSWLSQYLDSWRRWRLKARPSLCIHLSWWCGMQGRWAVGGSPQSDESEH
jgi:hypothetical protein